MNILMMTNTFTPHVGGVAHSVEALTGELRERDHNVLVIAPEFENMPKHERDVVRVPAIQRFNGSDFSVTLPLSGVVGSTVERFKPDVVHSHHPFLLGGTALRLAYVYQRPLVFTHHTMYEQYTHYVPGDSKALKQFVINLSTNYANLCDQVFAPSRSVAEILTARGVTAPIEVLPTGVQLKQFTGGSGADCRTANNIPEDAFVVGHVGRLAPEKNLEFLAKCVAAFLEREPKAYFLVVGEGPSRSAIETMFDRSGLRDRLRATGVLRGDALVSAYRAMDVFAFASQTETQGMVLSEAMAVSVPVVAVDAAGAREVVADGKNGRLLPRESVDDFVAALEEIAAASPERKEELILEARATAEEFSLERSADTALAAYERLKRQSFVLRKDAYSMWTAARRLIEIEWDLLRGIARGVGTSSDAEGADRERRP